MMRELIYEVFSEQGLNPEMLSLMTKSGFPSDDDIKFFTHVVNSNDLESTVKENTLVIGVYMMKCGLSFESANTFFKQLKIKMMNAAKLTGEAEQNPQVTSPPVQVDVSTHTENLVAEFAKLTPSNKDRDNQIKEWQANIHRAAMSFPPYGSEWGSSSAIESSPSCIRNKKNERNELGKFVSGAPKKATEKFSPYLVGRNGLGFSKPKKVDRSEGAIKLDFGCLDDEEVEEGLETATKDFEELDMNDEE